MISKREAKKRHHYLITIGYAQNFGIDSAVFRLASGVTRNGEYITIDDNGHSYVYSPVIMSEISVKQTIDNSAKSLSLQFYDPIYLTRLTDMFADISVVSEDSNGDISQSWSSRKVFHAGRIQSVSINPENVYTVIIDYGLITDTGGIFPFDGKLTSKRFPSISSGEAANSDGFYPSIHINSLKSGAGASSPLLVISNSAADAGVSGYVERQYIIGYEKYTALALPSSSEPLKIIHMEADGTTFRDISDGTPSVSIEYGYDDTGQLYSYVDDTVLSTVNTSVGSFDTSLPTVTGTDGKFLQRYRVGDAIRRLGDSVFAVDIVSAITDGNSLAFPSVYTGTTGTGSMSTYAVCPSIPYSAYISTVGVIGPRGTTIDSFGQLIEFLCQKSAIGYDIDYGSIRNLEALSHDMVPKCFINEQYRPFDFIDKIREVFPFSYSLCDGKVRFFWVGKDTDSDSVYDFVLDSTESDIALTSDRVDAPVDVPISISIGFKWSMIRDQFDKTATHSWADTLRADGDETYMSSGLLALTRQKMTQNGTPESVSQIETDLIPNYTTAFIYSAQKLNNEIFGNEKLTLDCPASYRWISIGNIVTVTGGVLDGIRRYRVVSTETSESKHILGLTSI